MYTFNIFKKLILASLLVGFVFAPFVSFAGGFVPCGGNGESHCQLCHLFVMIDTILDFVILKLTPVVAVLMLVVGGLMFFFAGADPEMVGKAKKIIINTVIGLAIIFTAWIVISTFLNYIGVMEWTELGSGGWSIINCPL